MQNLNKKLLPLLLICVISISSCKKADLPSVSTSKANTLTRTSAICGGIVNTSGSDNVLARGVCWDIYPAPKADLTTKTTDGTGTGEFTSNITGLEPGITYHVRAYATSAAGTSYGQEILFTTITQGEIFDKTGDSAGPDLKYGRIINYGDSILIHIEFVPGTFNAQTTIVQILLDVDCRPETGNPGVDAGGVWDANILGVDYTIDVWKVSGKITADFMPYNVINNGEYIDKVKLRYLSNGYDFLVNMKSTYNSGKINFKVTACTYLTENTITTIQDYMSDVGQPVGIVR